MSNRTPKPGKAVRGSRTGRPIMALLELWTPLDARIMWEVAGDTLSVSRTCSRCATGCRRASKSTTTRAVRRGNTGNVRRRLSTHRRWSNLLHLLVSAAIWGRTLGASILTRPAREKIESVHAERIREVLTRLIQPGTTKSARIKSDGSNQTIKRRASIPANS